MNREINSGKEKVHAKSLVSEARMLSNCPTGKSRVQRMEMAVAVDKTGGKLSECSAFLIRKNRSTESVECRRGHVEIAGKNDRVTAGSQGSDMRKKVRKKLKLEGKAFGAVVRVGGIDRDDCQGAGDQG